MSFIEGVGDEVVAFAVILLVFVLAATITFFLNDFPVIEQNRQILTTPETAPNQVKIYTFVDKGGKNSLIGLNTKI